MFRLTASSMVARQPCIDDKPYFSFSFSPSSDNLSVLGELKYVPISCLLSLQRSNLVPIRLLHNPFSIINISRYSNQERSKLQPIIIIHKSILYLINLYKIHNRANQNLKVFRSRKKQALTNHNPTQFHSPPDKLVRGSQ